MATENITSTIDCACVIHGDVYSWDYVDRLYSMLTRNFTHPVKLHVYTEKDRTVPEPYIKHELADWRISGPKKAWWYKIQLFNKEHHQGPLLYFDLDTVIVNNIDWIYREQLDHFWTVRDFKHLWNSRDFSINSSIMYFDTTRFTYIWDDFISRDFKRTQARYRGDQNYITDIMRTERRKYFDQDRVKSWRWECLDGGYDFTKKRHVNPGAGTEILPQTSVLIFHGNPKPKDVEDSIIVRHWR